MCVNLAARRRRGKARVLGMTLTLAPSVARALASCRTSSALGADAPSPSTAACVDKVPCTAVRVARRTRAASVPSARDQYRVTQDFPTSACPKHATVDRGLRAVAHGPAFAHFGHPL